MPSQRTELFRRAARWLWPAALLALAPKCVLCLLGYAGIGVALGLGGPELCGARADTAWTWTAAWLPALGLAAAAVTIFVSRIHRRAFPREPIDSHR